MFKVWTKSNTSEREGSLPVSVQRSDDFLMENHKKYNFDKKKNKGKKIFGMSQSEVLKPSVCFHGLLGQEKWLTDGVGWMGLKKKLCLISSVSEELWNEFSDNQVVSVWELDPKLLWRVLVYDLFFSPPVILILRDADKSGLWIDRVASELRVRETDFPIEHFKPWITDFTELWRF